MSERGDKHLREQELSSQLVYDGGFLKVYRDQVSLPDGTQTSWEYIKHPGAAVIIAELPDGQLVFERQYRYPLQCVVLELPAGKLEASEEPLLCAQRELAEETGYRAKQWHYLGRMHNAIAYSDEHIEIFLAQDLSLGERQLDAGEFLEISALSFAEACKAIQNGTITDAKTITALFQYQLFCQTKKYS